MKFLIVHLSDIHFVTKSNPILLKKTKLIDTIKNQTLEYDELFLLISGDSAFSGSEDEYFISVEFIEEIIKFLQDYSGKNVRVITIPGNHDCDFKTDSKARQNQIELIQKMGESAMDDSVISQLVSIQKNYKTYSKYFKNQTNIIFENDLLTVHQYELGNFKVIFYCYNTSYISEIHEQPGKMFFPVNNLPNIFSDIKADLIISTFHHPFNWYSPINRREFETHIHETSDFYLTGHEHEPSAKIISDLASNFVYHLEGSVLQDSKNPDRSEFNLISFDLSKKEFLYNTVIWADDNYHLQKGTAWTTYLRGKLKIKNKYVVKETFEKLLNDIGGKFTHPAVSEIKLEDLYVFPKIKQFTSKNSSDGDSPFIFEDAESIVKNLSKDNRIMILGNENVGKTAFLKTAFSILLKKNFVPVLINGENIKNGALDEIIKLVQRIFSEIYGEQSLEDFSQENIDNIYILIDDIDKSPLKNKKAKGRALENFGKYYKNLIITGNELFPLEEILTDEETSADLYSSFTQYEILEFNRSYRNKLIQKWYSLGLSDFQNDNEIWRKCDEANRAINIAMGNKIVPNYPIFILILLQALESTTGHNLQLSSYGNYYQLLILKSFSENIKDQADLTMYQNYCSELANYFFEKKTKTISFIEFVDFHNTVTSFDKFDLPFLTYEKAKRTLSEIGVIEEWNERIEFKYQYIYYFFQAKYFAQNISQDEVKVQISNLCKRLHRSEFANIIMFVIHFSKEEFILNELLKNAKAVFSELLPCRLEDDIKEIQTLLKELPKIYLQDRSISEVRKEEDEKIDRQESEKSEPKFLNNELPDPKEEIDEFDVIAKLNLGFKLMEILGQILKNNYGAMQGKIKYDLLKETYLLGLRSMNSFFSLITGSTDFLLNQLKSAVSEKDAGEEILEVKSRQILFSICSHIAFMFTKKLSDAIGTSKLADKFQKVEEEYHFTSIQMINYQIKLDQGSAFPNKELADLKKELEQFPLSYYVLKQMVISHLHRNPVDFKDKQRICEFLGIPIQRQLKFEHNRKKD